MQAHLSFALAYLRDPRRMGAIAPASRGLAHAMALEAQRHPALTWVEVGAGTGSVTQALSTRLPARGRLLLVERDATFAQRLQARYPQATVLNRCASELDGLVLPPQEAVTVVSSLPLLSLPRREARACIQALLRLLRRQPGSCLLQYTYAPHQPPFRAVPPGWCWRRVGTVWANLPPATVWALEALPGPMPSFVSLELH